MRTQRTVPIYTTLAVALFWLLDAMVDTFLYRQGDYAQVLLRPEAHEFYFRLVATFIIVVSGIFAYRSARSLTGFRESLTRSESRYHSLVEASPDCVVAHDGDKPLYANQRTREFLRLTPDQARRIDSLYEIIHPDDRPLVEDQLAQLAAGRSPHPCELRIVRRDSSVATVAASMRPMKYDGRPVTLSFFRDFGEEVETRRDLLASRERLSLALDAARDGVWDWDVPSGRMVYNSAWATMLGLELDQVEADQTTWQRLVHPDDLDRVEPLLAAHLRGDLPDYETEVRLRHADGHYIWVLDRGRVVERDAQGVPVRMAGTHRDITVRKQAEIALEVRNRLAERFLVARGNEVYDSVLELLQEVTESPVGLFMTMERNGDLRIVAVQHTGVGRHRHRIARTDISPLLTRVIENEHAVVHRGPTALDCCGFKTSDALAVPVMNRDNVLGIVLVAGRAEPYATADRVLMDSLAGYMAPILQSHLVNEDTEAKLRQSQKMEAIGVLAGGIAHDFNNILQAILGFTGLAREEAEPDSRLAHDLDRVLSATDRGRELVQRILIFSRREDQEIGPVDICTVTREILDLLRPTIPANVRLRSELSDGDCRVAADAGQIGQVILNLATNAIHAMEKTGGVLALRLERCTVADQGPDIPPTLRGSDVVVIEVVDTGCGMDATVLNRLYDPFFTTKDVGKGTGLGLSVVHGIVSAHGGEIRIESVPGEGTRATVFLPGIDESHPADTSARRSGRILMLESDTAAAAVASSFLRQAGHEVTVSIDQRQAVTTLEERADEFDLVVTGLLVPGGTGLDIVEAARRAGNLPVILTAGRGDNTSFVSDSPRPNNIAAVVQKPLSTIILGRVVEQALVSGESRKDSASRS